MTVMIPDQKMMNVSRVIPESWKNLRMWAYSKCHWQITVNIGFAKTIFRRSG
jgi:hypothetical protein